MSSQSGIFSSESEFNVVHQDKMRLIYFGNEFPRDDLHETLRLLQRHSKLGKFPILARFFDEATAAIKDELRQVKSTLRRQVPPFESILSLVDFADLRSRGALCESINGVLLCVVHIAIYIGYHERSPRKALQSASDTRLAGLGIGLLATAAISLAPTLADIPITGAQVVREAFRLGLLVDNISGNLQPQTAADTETQESWAYVLPEVTETEVQAELDQFHSSHNTPTAAKVFISAISATSTTISGPPNRLKNLLKNEFFRDRKSFGLPVYGGLCHAGHIYNRNHVLRVVQIPSIQSLDESDYYAPALPIYSTSSGKHFTALTTTGLFEEIVEEILTQAIQWDKVAESVLQEAQRAGVTKFEVLTPRNCLPAQTLVTAIQNLPHATASLEESLPWIHEQNVEASEGHDKPRGPAQSKIAIVGMSCRMPGGATDTEKFWSLLESGLDVHRAIPADRFDVSTHFDPEGRRMNASHTPYGCFIDEPGLFDAPFFNMSPREAQQTDPMQRLALVTAYEALERAGYVANRTSATKLERIGTFYGQASDDYREVNTAQEISTYFIPGGCRAFGPGRINYFFKFAGPSYSIDSACSSSLATIQSACTALWNGELDTAVVGGMNVLTNSDAFAGLSHGHFLSKTPNACRTYDVDADGYCRADGVASLVMKRLEDAEADNDNILGVILGAGTNHSAEAVSITHPHAGHQAYLNKLVLGRAGVDPLDVGYVEMHGTGTQAGDAEEIQSVSQVFAPDAIGKRRGAKNPLYIGSVKSNVGHGEAAAGVTALLKVLVMFQHHAIPPHVGIKTAINPKVQEALANRNINIPFEKVSWPRQPNGKRRIAVVNNFSAAGGNTTLAIEDSRSIKTADSVPSDLRPTHVVTVSAKSKISLEANLNRLLSYIQDNENGAALLPHLSYTTTARRYHHNHRVTFAASNAKQVTQQLQSAIDTMGKIKPIPNTAIPPVAFCFTGQGASYSSFNLELYHQNPFFRSQIQNLDEIAQNQGFPSFISVLDGSHPQDHQHSAVVSQLALTSIEIALAKYWATLNILPDVVVGHSLGEYAALHVAGVLSASDAIYLVGQRATLIERKCKAGTHKMVAVRASLQDIEECLATTGAKYEIACLNGPTDTVMSVAATEMKSMEELKKRGYKTLTLEVPYAFHSAQMDPVLDEFEALASSTSLFSPPQLPILSPLLKRVIFDEKTVNAEYLRRSTRETVNMLATLEIARDIGIIGEDTVWIEIGPHPVCIGFVKSSMDYGSSLVTAPSLRRGENNWTTMANSLSVLHSAGIPVEWQEYHRPFENDLVLLDLPTYAWNDKNHWIQYNGDWALTKGNDYYNDEKAAKLLDKSSSTQSTSGVSKLNSITVQAILEESFDEISGSVLIQSDISQSGFRAAAWGHKMNDCGVVTSSIHADIALTLGQYIYQKMRPDEPLPLIDIRDLVVSKGLVAYQDPNRPHPIQVRVSIDDIEEDTATLEWFSVDGNGRTGESFATASLVFTQQGVWQSTWKPMLHLVKSRIEDLERLAKTGEANKLSHHMAYQLFANSLVDYAPVYRGMQSVVLYGLEAFAEVTLVNETHSGSRNGNFTVPPHFIDSVAHLAGLVMNVSDALDTKSKFSVTPGWKSMRFDEALVPGGKYQSYVKMIPTDDDPSAFFGDVYILREGRIIGMTEGIEFHQYPRILLSRFFSAPDHQTASKPVAEIRVPKTVNKVENQGSSSPATKFVSSKEAKRAKKQGAKAVAEFIDRDTTVTTRSQSQLKDTKPRAETVVEVKNTNNDVANQNMDSVTMKAIQIIALESSIGMEELTDDANFSALGVDSLMSLVIAEKLRQQLGVVVNGSLFLEYPTIGDLRAWLDEYYS